MVDPVNHAVFSVFYSSLFPSDLITDFTERL